MRARMATLLGTLLLLSALGLPTTTAKTGDDVCSTEEIWFDDAAADGGYRTEGQFTPSGELDIDTFTIDEEGDDCEFMRFTLATEDATVQSVDATVSSVTIRVDLAAAGDVEWHMVYVFDSGGAEVTLHNNGGAAIEDEDNITTGTNAEGAGYIVINKTMFEGTAGFIGVFAEVTDATLTLDADQQVLVYDSATDERVVLVDFGIDADDDGMPDKWEQKTFGHLNQTARTDQDGDGHADVDEYRTGTDPLDPLDPPLPPAPYPTITHPDTDGQFGMRGDYFGEFLAEGDSYNFTFKNAGNFGFFSDNDKLAQGTIEVKSTTAEGGARLYVVEAYQLHHMGHEGETMEHEAHDTGWRVLNGSQAGSAKLTINRGDTVIFTNNAEGEHNVRAGNGADFLEGDFTEDPDKELNGGYLAVTSIGLVLVVAVILVGLLGRWKA